MTASEAGAGFGRQHYEDLVRRYFQMVNDENVDGAVECFAEDAVLHFPMAAEPVRGHAALREFFRAHVDGFREHEDRMTSFLMEGDRGASEIEFDAVAATGKPLHIHACNLYRFKGGKFQEVRIYVDTAPLREAFS